jgi:hypothetical protein
MQILKILDNIENNGADMHTTWFAAVSSAINNIQLVTTVSEINAKPYFYI